MRIEWFMKSAMSLIGADPGKVATYFLAVAVAAAGLWFGFGILNENPAVWGALLLGSGSLLFGIAHETAEEAHRLNSKKRCEWERKLIGGAGVLYCGAVALGSGCVLIWHPASMKNVWIVLGISGLVGVTVASFAWRRAC